jgi:hypothetical protein
MTVEQSLVKLCPPQWRNAALFRNFATHSRGAVRNGNFFVAARLLRSTIARTGVAGLLRAAASDSIARLKHRGEPRSTLATARQEAMVPRHEN